MKKGPKSDGPGDSSAESDPTRDKKGGVAFPVAGVGASAGGLEAFKQFLSGMPVDSGLSIILIQHLDPTRESMMVELLSRCSELSVVQIEDGMELKKDHVYVIPPNHYVELEKNRLKLIAPLKQRGMRMPIDHFFHSLASQCGARAISIVLSGTGSDGALGMKSVKEAGGMTIAEDPKSAGYDGMPRASINSGAVDFVLPVEAIPETLCKYIRHPYIADGDNASLVQQSPKDHFQSILSILRTKIGYDFRSYKKGTLSRRIERRLGLNQMNDLASYVKLLREKPEEVQLLFQDLLIGVTAFFRDSEAWESLEKEVMFPLVERKDLDQAFRVWIPGCSSGEEAYTVAILLFEQFESQHKTFNAQIFATDIDENAIERARAGRYPKSIAADISEDRLNRFFDEDGDEYVVKKKLRESVTFAIQNLISDPPFSKLDLISCRNLLIYLDKDIQDRIAQMFHFALADQGYLFLGNSESSQKSRDFFRAVNKSSRIFQKIGMSAQGNFPVTAGDPKSKTDQRNDVKSISTRAPGVAELAKRSLLKQFAPAAILINRTYDCLYFHGQVRKYLDFPSGEPSRDLSEIILEGLKNKLRASVHQAIKNKDACTTLIRRFKREDDYFNVRITVLPLEAPPPDEDLFLVTFEDETESTPPQEPDPDVDLGEDREMISHLEYELNTTREDLQSTIEELETSNEELKASNEEVMSMNEELQSTNEELETSREELQSLNEELTTVNSQLEDKVSELEDANNDLSNLLSSTNIITIFLDTEFRIRSYTPATKELIHLIPSDKGRPFSDIATRFSNEHLLNDAEKVLAKLVPIEREVDIEDGTSYICRVLPYRTGDDRIEGVVITFTDVTELKHRSSLVDKRRRQQAMVAQLGSSALAGESAESLARKAVKEAARVLDAPLSKVLKIGPDRKYFFLTAGVGWKKGIVGKATIETGLRSQAGYTLESAGPVIVKNLRRETRFTGPDLLFDHDVVSGVSVRIGPEERPWGVFGVHSREEKHFTEDDIQFLQAVAYLIYAVTEREKTLADLETSRMQYQLVTDAMPVLIAYSDRDLVYQFCNDAYRQWFGLEKEEIIGQTLPAFVGEEGFRKLEPWIKKALEGERVSFEAEIPYANGAKRHIFAEYVPDERNGEVVGYYAMIQDITNRVKDAEARSRLASIVESSQHAIYAKDPDGRITSWNHGAELLFGFSSDEMIGQNVSILVPDQYHEEMLRNRKKVNSGERIDYYETIRRRKDGKIVDVSISLSPLFDTEGNVIGSSSIEWDISESRESSERLKLALAAGKMGVWDWDIDSGNCTFDGLISKLLGFPEGVRSCSIEEFFEKLHPDDRLGYRDILEKAQNGEVEHEGEFRIEVDGEYRWIAVRFHIRTDPDGKPVQLIGLDWDITQTKEFESELSAAKVSLEQRVEERTRELRVLSENVPALFAFLDRDLKFAFTNPLYERKFVMEEGELIGRSIEGTLTPENFEEMKPRLLAALAGEPQGFEITLDIPRDGSRIIRAQLVPRREPDDSVPGIFLLAEDVTDERRLQQEVLEAGELEKARIGRDLHDSICQELTGTSLFAKAFIRGIGESIESDKKEEAEELVDKINRTTQNARKLARGLSPVVLEKKTLAEALKELADSVDEVHEKIHCKFVGTSKAITIDDQVTTQLYLIAREAVYNAVRHSEASLITISLSISKDHITVSVRDDGGHDPSDLKEDKGVGLRSMRYRARTLGGSLFFRSSEEEDGIEVICRLKIPN